MRYVYLFGAALCAIFGVVLLLSWVIDNAGLVIGALALWASVDLFGIALKGKWWPE